MTSIDKQAMFVGVVIGGLALAVATVIGATSGDWGPLALLVAVFVGVAVLAAFMAGLFAIAARIFPDR